MTDQEDSREIDRETYRKIWGTVPPGEPKAASDGSTSDGPDSGLDSLRRMMEELAASLRGEIGELIRPLSESLSHVQRVQAELRAELEALKLSRDGGHGDE